MMPDPTLKVQSIQDAFGQTAAGRNGWIGIAHTVSVDDLCDLLRIIIDKSERRIVDIFPALEFRFEIQRPEFSAQVLCILLRIFVRLRMPIQVAACIDKKICQAISPIDRRTDENKCLARLNLSIG